MKIFDKEENLLLDIAVDDNSYRNRVVMGEHNLTLYYSLPEHLEIPVGAFCVYEGETYTLMRPENLKMKHSRWYEYTVVFSSEQEKTKIWKFRNPVDGRLKFPLTAKPKEHLQMLVDNMNRRDTGWTLGVCIEDVEKLVSYDHDFCWDALGKMASEFETEFEIVGKRVSLKKVEYDKSSPLPLAYGKGNGFKPGVGRSNTSDALPVEILYVQGGETNIDRSKYPSDETLRAISNGCLLLPVGQTIGYDGEHFEGEEGYDSTSARHYQVDDLGLSIRNIDREISSMAEDSLDRSDDYPKRVGTISSVVCVDDDKHFYDFTDDTIPEDLNYEDYLIGEDEMTVIFQSGELAGREFDIKYHHEAKTINGNTKAGRRFEIVPQEIDGVMMPGDSFVPSPGDKYAVFHVMLPDAYIRDDETKTGASWDMFKAAARYLFDNEEKKFSFSGELDGIWAKQNWTNIGGKIRLGGFIKFTHEQIAPEGVLARITSIKDYINKPHSPKIEISNDTVSASVSTTLKTLASTEVLIEQNHRSAIQFTKRRYRDSKETLDMLSVALSDNFDSRINPITVETMALLVGDERLQFQFVLAPGYRDAIPHNITFEEETKQLVASAGTIQHLTLGIDSIRPSHDPNEYLYWNVASFRSASLTDGSEKYYLYIKARQQYTGEAGVAEFRLETIPHKIQEGSYYWFLVGILNTEYDGSRSFATLYGFTEILPGRITADRLLSSDGESYFDMANDALRLKDKLQYNVNGDGELRIKGVIVQSQNGTDEAPLGCFRGDYNDTTTYFNGDLVTYRETEDTPLSTYRCVSTTPISGVEPTNSLRWQVVAAGAKGADGTSITVKGTFSQRFSTRAQFEAASVVRGYFYLIDRDETLGTNCVVAYASNRGVIGGGYATTYIEAEEGDAWVNSADGHLYVANPETGWHDVGQFKGDEGNYTEYRFAVNGSTTTPPLLVSTSLNPSGWATTMPTVSKGYYLWMTRAVKNGSGTALVSNWSTPVRLSAQDGAPGKNGLSPAMVYRGVYSASKTYTGNQYRVDCVKQGSSYYVARPDAGDFSGVQPPNTDKWNPFGASFESVATDLLLAENANIGGWIFRNGRLESESRVKDSSGQDTEEPMAFLNGVEGTCKLHGIMQLSTAYSGNISNANIFFLPAQTSVKDMTMMTGADQVGKVVRLFNSGKISSGHANYRIACKKWWREGNTSYTSHKYYALVRPQECVELTCLQTESAAAEWEITSRFSVDNFHTEGCGGRFPRIWCMGRVNFHSSSSQTISGKMWNGKEISSVMSITRNGTGDFTLSFPSGTFPSGCQTLVSGFGALKVDARVVEEDDTHIRVGLSDDASTNDSSFNFWVFDPLWYYDTSEI